jgi:hypothetical protein
MSPDTVHVKDVRIGSMPASLGKKNRRNKMLFRHRNRYRKKDNAPLSHINIKYFGDGRIQRDRFGKFVPGLPEHSKPVDKLVDNFSSPDVVVRTLTGHNGGVKGKEETTEMGKSHRVAMAQALLTELAEAYQRHGDTDGTRRLQAMVARMVAELLYR